jgi:hypothetical protein
VILHDLRLCHLPKLAKVLPEALCSTSRVMLICLHALQVRAQMPSASQPALTLCCFGRQASHEQLPHFGLLVLRHRPLGIDLQKAH